MALATLAAGACDEAAGTPPVVIARQTAAAAVERAPPPDGADRITVLVGDAELAVEVAANPGQRQVGLSGRTALNENAGMLFYFSTGKATGLWMQGMLFGLDFIWIGESCTVVDIHTDVPVPSGTEDSLPIYRPGEDAAAVIEIKAGGVRTLGIALGDVVRYGPSILGSSYGCEE